MNNCGPEKDRYWKIQDVNKCGPEMDRYMDTRAVNHCGSEKDRYCRIRDVNHCGPEKDRYRHIPYANNCCPEKDRYWSIRDVNNCGPEKDRYWWDIPYVNNPGGPKRAVITNYIMYTVSVFIASMAASIIFLSVGTRRVFPAEIFLNRDVASVSAICMVSSTSSICSSFSWRIACSLPAGGSFLANGPGRDRFADIATGNSIIDGTSGLVQALVAG